MLKGNFENLRKNSFSVKLLNEYLKTACLNSFRKVQSEFILGVHESKYLDNVSAIDHLFTSLSNEVLTRIEFVDSKTEANWTKEAKS